MIVKPIASYLSVKVASDIFDGSIQQALFISAQTCDTFNLSQLEIFNNSAKLKNYVNSKFDSSCNSTLKNQVATQLNLSPLALKLSAF